MLEHLEIKNFALIDRLSIDFCDGFNVITGETGAGKSIILGALSLLQGEKADSSAVRQGEDECSVSAVFSVPGNNGAIAYLRELGIEPEDGCIFIRRTVKSDGGRQSIRIQGSAVSRNDLRTVADYLIDMHSQHEHQSLLVPEKQREILDSFAGLEEDVQAYRIEYRKLAELVSKKDELAVKAENAEKERDYLEYSLREIEKLSPKKGEDEEIRRQLSLLRNFETVSESLALSQKLLSSAKGILFDCEAAVAKASSADSGLEDVRDRIASARIETEDLFETIRDRLFAMDFSEEKLDELSSRLSGLQKLMRKHGGTMDSLLSFEEEARRTLEDADGFDAELKLLGNKIDAQRAVLKSVADALTKKREEAGSGLEKLILSNLTGLGMPSAKFTVCLSRKDMGRDGQDDVCFMISPNAGESERPIAKIASGGELSRVMLAVKTVLSSVDNTDTQVFDEVDAGIGGSVALSVAQRLKEISAHRQVIAITHLATIAAKADEQFVVSKSEEGGRTYSKIRSVRGEERVAEISRMLSGDGSDEAVSHARAMLNRED